MSIEDYVKSEQVNKFEKDTGVVYEDFFDNINTPVSDMPESYDGKSNEDISILKDVGYSAGASFIDFLKSSMALGMEGGYVANEYALDQKFEKQGMSRVKGNIEWDEEKKEAVDVVERKSIDLEPSYEPKTIAGNITYGIGKAGLGYMTAAKTLGAAGLTGSSGLVTKISLPAFAKTKEAIQIGKVLSPVLNNMVGNVAAFWSDKENLSNILQENIDNKFAKTALDYLAIDEDDSVQERILKHAADSLFTDAGAAALFKGIKYIKQGIKSEKVMAKLSGKLKDAKGMFSDNLSSNLKDSVETVAVNDGAGITDTKKVKGKSKVKSEGVQPTQGIAEEVKSSENVLAKAVQELRQKKPESYSAIRTKALDKFSETFDIDYSEIDTTKVREFLDMDHPEIDKVVASVYNQEVVADSFLTNMKNVKKEFDAGTINLSQRDKVFESNLIDLADAFAATQDAVSQSGRALGYVSKSETHKEIKKIINGIIDNADTMDKDAIYKAFSEVDSLDELAAKFDKLVQIAEPSGGKLKKGINKFVALQQAGLMTNVNTVARNLWTGLEMATTGAVEDIIARGVGKTRGFMRKLLGGGENYDLTSATQGINFVKNFMDNSFEVIRYSLDRIKKNPVGESPAVKYRRSVGGGKTYLPQQVGKTFDESKPLGKLGNKWMRFSGVGISEGIDDFMGNVFYRTEVESRAMAYANKVAAEKGLTKAQTDALYKKTVQNATDIDMEGAKNLAMMSEDFLVARAISKKSRNYALEQTFRGGEGGITQWLTSGMRGPLALFRPLVPFVKTASTIAFDRFANDRTFFGLFNPKTWATIKAGGRAADRVIARQAVGNGMLTLGGYLFTAGMITGDYPKNKGERALWKAKGIQPNSIRITNEDGTSKYISLDGLGVISTALKTGARAAQAFEEYNVDGDNEINLLNSLMLKSQAIGETLIDDTLFRYMGDFMKAVENNDEKNIQKIKDKLAEIPLNVIPRIGDGLFNSHEEAMQTADDLYEKTLRKLGMSTSDALDLFGKPISAKEKFIGPLAGFNVSKSKPDVVLDEMYRVGAFVEEPYKTMKINSTSLELTPDQVYAVKSKISDMGVYEIIEGIIKQPYYNSLTNNKKADLIKNVYNKAKKGALISVINSYPELQEQMKNGVISMHEQYEPTRSDVNAILDVPTLR
jgi:hypothetical protein